MAKRKGHPPVETGRPGPRRAARPPVGDINTPVHVPRSLLLPISTLQRCIMAKDGMQANNRQWLEIDRKHTRIEAMESITRGPYAQARVVTADGRRWIIEAREDDL